MKMRESKKALYCKRENHLSPAKNPKLELGTLMFQLPMAKKVSMVMKQFRGLFLSSVFSSYEGKQPHQKQESPIYSNNDRRLSLNFDSSIKVIGEGS
ncbi:hypothetical protein LIER_35237 [Lithospermum erythrorhizon]|uniref:Uncharacterized protein n=1 Tax=Lithospermum erythrorhizon TaxID=34254 RepID=A0AAV3NQY2_LITER